MNASQSAEGIWVAVAATVSQPTKRCTPQATAASSTTAMPNAIHACRSRQGRVGEIAVGTGGQRKWRILIASSPRAFLE